MEKSTYRYIWIGLGIVFVIIGTIGIVLPLLPTTPFLLLAATCFSKGSKRFYDKLINHKILGPYIRDYKSGKGIPIRVKVTSITLLWLGILFSAVVVVPVWIGKVVLLIIAIAVTYHILKIRTKK